MSGVTNYDYEQEDGLMKVFYKKNRPEAIAVCKDDSSAQKICDALNMVCGVGEASEELIDSLFTIGKVKND